MSDPLSSRADVIAEVNVSPIGGHAFLLQRLRFTDALSRPFRLDVELVSTGGDVDPARLLGHGLSVTVPRPGGGERHLHGIVRHAERRVGAGDTAVYSCTAVPRIEIISHGRDHRIFLGTSVKEILEAVFSEHGLEDYDDSGLQADYPPLEQCVQYGESHRDFVHRLLERFGICYYHQHDSGNHTLTLADSSAEHGPLAGAESLPFHPDENAAVAREHVHAWAATASIRPGSFATKDYDYIDPKTDVQGSETAGNAYPHGDLEWFEYPAGCRTIQEAEAAAERRMEAFVCRSAEVRGEARATGLAVGHTFRLTGCPVAADNRGYLVTGVELDLEPLRAIAAGEGAGGGFTTACRFTAIPDDVQFRPARSTPVPRVHGVQPAVVVGPSGQDPKMPYTDTLGRIKVQFHWDRQGRHDENSSCWLRTPHQSAGHGYGHVWLPRVGCEVLVAFVDGDPDRPTIVGHVYNGQTTLPLDLPREARVGIIKDDGGNYMKIDATDGGQVMAMFSPTEKSSLTLGKT
ncbi:MAG: type VI secretion system tip protein VgrG [Planctomycetia bacterium]|nr:type VI secretion system tip protein VgrG [Planctomycetia bacterium]